MILFLQRGFVFSSLGAQKHQLSGSTSHPPFSAPRGQPFGVLTQHGERGTRTLPRLGGPWAAIPVVLASWSIKTIA